MSSFPIALQILGRRAVIVGGGNVALRKVRSLLAAGALVRVVAPQINEAIRRLALDAPIECISRSFAPDDVNDAFLVIAATCEDGVNAAAMMAAQRARILCSDTMEPQRGNFTMPATHRTGSLTFTVDTGGTAPAFATRLRDEIALAFGEQYAAAARAVAMAREYLHTRSRTQEREGPMRVFARSPLSDLSALNRSQVQRKIDELLENERSPDAPSNTTAVCASRSSALAMVQFHSVASRLAAHGISSKVLKVSTTGDKIQDRSIAAIGAESLFVKELELALRDRRADYAVHSCKDLPSSLPPDMALCAITTREDPRDAFCSENYETFRALPAGARVGTSSLRRRAQLARIRPDLRYDDVRGNVDTRLNKLRAGSYDALVLAMAGLTRLNVGAKYIVPFEIREVVPAVGQGALAIETRREDAGLRERLRAALNDARCELAIVAERAALRELQGGCQAPIGIYGSFAADGDALFLQGVIASFDGRQHAGGEQHGTVTSCDQAERLGLELARQLLGAGGGSILKETPRAASQPLSAKLILLPRTMDRPSRIAPALRKDGAEVLEVRSSAAARVALGERIPNMIVFPSSGSVAAVRSYLQDLQARGLLPAIAAMGPDSAAAAQASGSPPDVVAHSATIEELIEAVRSHLNVHFTEPQHPD